MTHITNINTLAKYALISRVLLVHFSWLNDILQGTNVYAPHLKQASKSFTREAEEYLKKWYKEHLVKESVEMSFNDILTAWENLFKELLFAEPVQVDLVAQAIKALREHSEITYREELPKAFLIREEAGLYSLFEERMVIRSEGEATELRFVATPVKGCKTEVEAYEKAFEYAREKGLLPRIEEGGQNE